MKKILLTSLLIFILYFNSQSQNWFWQIEELANMPMPISNNAVVEGEANDTGYVYSFGGLDSTKVWSGITKKSFRYNTATDVWDTIPDLPNPNVVIAAGASYVDSIIYIMGGYQVLSNGSEISSNIVNRFDPRTNSYLSDGTNIPVPIDDHVQAVWNDSLIYIITGWSNTGNVPNVQIYDPSNDNWLTGTAVPNNNIYRAFGSSGTIVGNTIYYHGGASTAFNFPVQTNMRVGTINPSDPTQITWSFFSTTYPSYRAISFTDKFGTPHFIGGSDITYNYNGIAYNGSGGVNPNKRDIYYFNTTIDTALIDTTFGQLPMDLRGIGSFPNHSFYTEGVWYIAGGMEKNQKVSDKTIRLIYTLDVSRIKENSDPINFTIYPNPTRKKLNVAFKNIEQRTIRMINVLGDEILRKENNDLSIQLDISIYPKGIYFINVESEKGINTKKVIVQ